MIIIIITPRSLCQTMGMQHITLSNYNNIISKYHCHAFSLLPPAMYINPSDSQRICSLLKIEMMMIVMLMKAIFATELLSSKNDCFATPITLLSLEIIHERGSYYTCSISQEI